MARSGSRGGSSPPNAGRRDGASLLLVTVGLAAFVAAVIYGRLSPGTYQDDDVDHYYLALQALKDPGLFLDAWGMPLFTLMAAIPARVAGYGGVEALNAALTALASIAAGLTARRLGLRFPWLVAGFVFLQPLVFELSFSALTEPAAAAVLALALLAWYRGRFGTAVILAGLLPLARIEGGLIWGIFLLAGVRRAGWRALMVSALPLLLWNLGGFLHTGDPLFVLALGGEKPLNSLGLAQYPRNLIVALGPPILFFVLWGFLDRGLSRTGNQGGHRFPVLAAVILVAHFTALMLLGWDRLPFGRSVGFLRHLVVIAPALALVAGVGFHRFVAGEGSHRVARLGFLAVWPLVTAVWLSHELLGHSFVLEGREEWRWIVTLALAVTAAIFLWKPPALRMHVAVAVGTLALCAGITGYTVRPIPLNPERKAILEAIEYLRGYGLQNAQVYTNHPWFVFLSGRDRYDLRKTPHLTRANLDEAVPGALVLWENHYGDRLWGDVPLEVLLGDARFRRILELAVGETGEFKVVMFERLP